VTTTATPEGVTARTEGRTRVARLRGTRWWKEVVYILAFYGVYTVIRNTQGSAGSGLASHVSALAYRHARSVINIERDLWMYQERAIQQAFIGARLFLQFWDTFYGSAHFVITAVALIWLFRRAPARYALWRNTLALTTALALIGFATYPLMPPRLLDAMEPARHWGFVDTLARYGGSWSFDSGTMQKISNQYAAMPSLHCAWAIWSACVLVPGLRRWWTRAFVVAYPLITTFGVVVTANHYILDAVGGAVVFGIAYLLVRRLTPWTARRTARWAPEASEKAVLPTDYASPNMDGSTPR